MSQEFLGQSLDDGWSFIFLPEVDSTNNYARLKASELNLPCLILTDKQTQGRGRGDHKWISHAKDSFTGTFVIGISPKNPKPFWTLLAGYIVFRSLEQTLPGWTFSIKAPNDIYLGEKKVAGLLLESFNTPQSLVLALGLGLNITNHPPELKDAATDLQTYAGAHNLQLEWPKLGPKFTKELTQNLSHFDALISQPDPLAIISEKLIRALNLNPHHLQNPVKGILPDGSLKLTQGTQSWQSL